MRIAIAGHNGRQIGGTETYVAALIPELMRRGPEVAAWFETARGPGRPLVSSASATAVWTAGADPGAAVRELAGWKPDVLFIHGLQSLSTERAMLEIAPAVAFAHSYYGTCISGTKSHSFPVATPCDRRFGAPCMAQFYPRRCGGLNPVTMLRQFRLQDGRLRTLASYARILVASRHMAHEYERHGLGAKVRVVGLPAPPCGASAIAHAAEDCWRLLYLGRLETTKGTPLLLDSVALAAAALQKPVVLEIAGDGSLRARLEAQAARLRSIHRNLTIRFHGQLAAEDRDRLIRASHLLLVPSSWPEPFGLVGLEAAAAGVPAVAFDVGGIRDWLVDGRTGVLVDPAPHAARRSFADAVTRCLADPDALRTMGNRAREHAATFALDRHVERVLAELSGVAAARA
jgi:glycosyltransferase involved in cell wall biosynthesis